MQSTGESLPLGSEAQVLDSCVYTLVYSHTPQPHFTMTPVGTHTQLAVALQTVLLRGMLPVLPLMHQVGPLAQRPSLLSHPARNLAALAGTAVTCDAACLRCSSIRNGGIGCRCCLWYDVCYLSGILQRSGAAVTAAGICSAGGQH